MRKKALYSALIVICTIALTGCSFFKFLSGINKEQLNITNNSITYSYTDNQIIINTEFSDEIQRNFLLDLGSPINMVFIDSSLKILLENYDKNNNKQITKSADGTKMKRDYINWGTIKTSWFELENSFISTLERPDNYACKTINGIWGASIFAPYSKGKKNKILLIQIQDSTAILLDSLPLLNNWIKMDADFTLMSHIKLSTSIGGKKASFYFDTGFSGSILMTRETYHAAQNGINRINETKKIYGYITKTLSGTQIDTAYQNEMIFDFGKGIIADSVTVLSTQSIAVNAIGMEFIRRFNVLVDYQKNNLYLQPNPNYRESQKTFFQSKGFKARNMDGNAILVINMEVNGTAEKAGLKIGDQILSINNIEADDGNNCEVVRLFGEIDGNSTRNVVTIKRGNEILKLNL